MTPNLTLISHPLGLHALSSLRNRATGTAAFREGARRIGLILAQAVTQDLPMTTARIETPLEWTEAPVLAGPAPCIVSILRAGTAIQQSMLELIPDAVAGHIGLARDEDTLRAREYYLKLPPDIGDRLTILVDPMLATGGSASTAVTRLRQHGAGAIRFACLLAAPEGLRRFSADHPDVPVFTLAIDRQLDARGYICPGLGDAGDRFHGT